MSDAHPRISVITPCYNSERFVGQTIESVRDQTERELEHIIIDDGSTDGSVVVVESYSPRDPRLKLVRQVNRGASAARNAGFAAADPASEYLWFLDADDCLEPEAIQVAIDYLDRHQDVGIVYFAVEVVDAAGVVQPDKDGYSPAHRYVPRFLGARRLPLEQPETPFHSLFAYYLAIPSVCCMRRSVYERTSGWDERFERAQDKDMILQMAMQAPVHMIPRKMVSYRRHDTNLSGPSVYRKLKPVHEKWWAGEHMDPGQRRIARSAVLFDMRLAARLQLSSAISDLRRRRLKTASRRTMDAAKKAAACAWWSAKSVLEDWRPSSRQNDRQQSAAEIQR
jgi:glycosyltransferase involved in cell wall biosynthesis